MLVVSELGEAIEAHRHGDREGFEEEIADTFIRLADLCGGLGIDIERAENGNQCHEAQVAREGVLNRGLERA